MIWRNPRRVLDLSESGVVMGILNVTPDSFSDGGRFEDPAVAAERAFEMERSGATIIDVGGESTRPGSDPVSESEELSRVIPVIGRIRERSDVLISIDTQKSGVASAALDAGADIINDVSAMRNDPDIANVAARSGAGLILMHMRGTPKNMQEQTAYRNLGAEIREFLRQRFDAAVASSIDPMAIALDPGIGFGKTPGQNLVLLRECGSFGIEGRPVVIGASRKSFFREITRSDSVDDRFWPGVAATSLCRESGARIFRVHDVAAHADALHMTEAIMGAG